MELSKISTRYAKAIYNYALSVNEETVVRIELQEIVKRFVEMPHLKEVMDNPTIASNKKETLLLTIVGEKPSKAYRSAIRLIIDNHREDYVSSIALIYEKIYKAQKGIISAKLKSVTDMADSTKDELKNIISDGRQTVDFQIEKVPSIIGGFILEVEDIRLDASVQNQLKEIKKELIKK